MGFFHRQPESGALDEWEKQMISGMTADEVTEKFLKSEEFLKIAQLQQLLFVPPGHYYSPIVAPDTVQHLFLNQDCHYPLVGINIQHDKQLKAWETFLPYLYQIPFRWNKSPDFRYYYNNSAFSTFDSNIYFAMLLAYHPKKIIEIGSGYSSACALDVIEHYLKDTVNITFIEPYPDLLFSLLKTRDNQDINILPIPVQKVDVKLFQELDAGDILFIDSTHILKTGSDVHYELLDILPALKSGVIIHIHDIFWPFEYPRSWVIDEGRSWNEVYALRAFLMYNNAFHIVFFYDYFAKTFSQRIQNDFPSILDGPGGSSMWLKKM